MKKAIAICAVLLSSLALPLNADTLGLFDWAFNVNGTLYENFGGGIKPAHTGTFNWTTGLGTMNITLPGSGARAFAVFLDHEINLANAGAQFNEYGATHGTPAAGQTWEIDEPGWAAGYTPAGPILGDIYGHATSSPPALENLNSVFSAIPYDVSMALAWNFVTPAGHNAIVGLRVAETAPTGGFYLSHTDAETLATLYFSGNVTFQATNGVELPEPGTWALLGTILVIVAGSGLKRRR